MVSRPKIPFPRAGSPGIAAANARYACTDEAGCTCIRAEIADIQTTKLMAYKYNPIALGNPSVGCNAQVCLVQVESGRGHYTLLRKDFARVQHPIKSHNTNTVAIVFCGAALLNNAEAGRAIRPRGSCRRQTADRNCETRSGMVAQSVHALASVATHAI